MTRRLRIALLLAAALPAFTAAGELARRPYAGIAVGPSPDGANIAVSGVVPDGPSAKSGIQVGDIIIEVDNDLIETPQDFTKTVRSLDAGAAYPAKIRRGGEELEIQWTFGALPYESYEGRETVYTSVESPTGTHRSILVKPAGDGPFPVVFFIQGLSCATVEAPMGGDNPYARFVDQITGLGYAVYRVEKSGIGDSVGTPCEEIGFEQELAGYRAGYEQLRAMDGVDPQRIYLMGHSMGGFFAPRLAAEVPVAGVAAYGTGMQNWVEYVIRINRDQSALAGAARADVEDAVRLAVRFQTLLCVDKLTIPEILERHPEIEEYVRGNSPDGRTMYSRSAEFFHELYDQEMARVWAQVEAPVAAMWGEADFVSYRDEHEAIAAVVNEARPGNGTFLMVPGADHGFRAASSFRQSMEQSMALPFSEDVVRSLVAWIEGLGKQDAAASRPR
ncbi:MAG: alpha/beta fold hydrolase [Candidatus Sumerlaeia bacterium]|nr:alpha/beta fold hydrolase [Candidatus Sumerlaeia bacterium]